MKTSPFPLDRLRTQRGTLSFNEFGASLDIPLEPFELVDHGRIETRISIDCIALPTQDIAALAMRTFRFPQNPAEGAPEGSMYILRHHPVDLLAIQFGPIARDTVEVHMALGFAFSFEGLSAGEHCEYADVSGELTAEIVVLPPVTRH